MNTAYIFINSSGYVVGNPEPSVKEAMDEAAWLGQGEGQLYEVTHDSNGFAIQMLYSVFK